MGPGMSTQKNCSSEWAQAPSNTWFLGPTRVHSQHCKWHLDCFSRFSRAHGYVQQTNRPRNIGNKRPHLCAPCTRCSLITTHRKYRTDILTHKLIAVPEAERLRRLSTGWVVANFWGSDQWWFYNAKKLSIQIKLRLYRAYSVHIQRL